MHFHGKEVIPLAHLQVGQAQCFKFPLGAEPSQCAGVLICRNTDSPYLQSSQIDDASVIHEVAPTDAMPQEEPIVIEAEPIIDAAPAEIIDVPSEPVIQEVVSEVSATELEEPKHARKKRAAASGVRKKAASPRPRATPAAKRSRKKSTTENEPS